MAMVSFGDAIKAQSRVIMCNLLGGPSSVPYLGGTPNPDINALQKRINGARKYFCNESDEITEDDITTDYGGEPSPFTGGQCPGVSYRVSWNAGFIGCATGVVRENIIRGAITVTGPVTREIETRPRPTDPTTADNLFKINGSVVGGLATKTPCQPSSTDGNASSVFWGLFSIVRIDGQPDNCGDPPPIPPTIPPYVPTPIIINIEYEDNDNVTINEEVTFNIFAPIVLVGGAIIAPITVTGNDFSLVGEVQLNGELNVELKPEFNFGPRGQVDTEPPDPDAPYPQPERPEGSRAIIGAIVTATTVSSRPATQIGQDGNPDIFAPRVGNLAFYIATDKGSAWTSDIPIKNVRQYVPCPSNFGAVDVAATAEPGWALNVEPVWDYPGLP